jgi:hypothetical protein
MVEVECRTERREGVTLVAAVVINNTSVRRRVRVEHALDGPTWPPRRHGVPVEGWNGSAYVATVAAGDRTAVGFASPAPPESPAVSVTENRRVDPADGETETPATAEDVVRRLGDPSPPVDAVPMAGDGSSSADASPDAAALGSGPNADADLPSPVAEWFRTVVSRLETAENCTDAATLREATRAVEDAGSLDDVKATVDRLEADAAALRAVERRAGALADRTARAAGSVPLATLRTLS